MDVNARSILTIERWQKRPLSSWISWAIFLCLPVLVILAWGGLLTDDAYLSMRFAQTLGRSSQFVNQLLFSSLGYTPLSPLAWLLLAVPAQLGWHVEFVASVLSAFGWGVTAVVWQKLLREWQLPVVDWLVPLLLVVSPVVVLTQGSFVSWFVALAWLAILLTVRQQWWAQMAVLFVLLIVNVSITAVGLVFTLLIWRFVMEFNTETRNSRKNRGGNHRNLPITTSWLTAGLLALVSLLALVGLGWQMTRAPWQISFPVSDWLSWGRQWLYAGEFVWLFVLFSLVVIVRKRQMWPIAIWLVFAVFDINWVGQAVAATGMLFLAGVGIATIAQYIVKKQWFDLVDDAVYLGAVVLFFLPMVWVMGSVLLNMPQDLSIRQDAIEVGEWLRENSEPDAVIMAKPAVGYFADRLLWSWHSQANQQSWADFIRTAGKVPHDYIVTNDGLFWDGLRHLDWWNDRAVVAETIGSLDIWEFAPQPALLAETVPLNVVLENGVRLVGYQQAPQSIMPGEAVNVSLHFQVDEPLGNGFATVIWLPSPLDGASQAQRDLLTPRAVPSNWWELGQTVTEQFVLTTTEQIPMGSYHMAVSFRTQDSYDKMPVYQNDDSNPLDRISLGYVAVPWDGDMRETSTPLHVRFGDEFQLLAAELPSAQVNPGQELPIQFYWEAVNPNRPQHNYTIFIHLMNEQGEMVANIDSPPQGGQYQTAAWIPGEVVPDWYHLLLPPDLPPGNYEIRVGAYLPETGERLSVFDEVGNEVPGASLFLMDLVVE